MWIHCFKLNKRIILVFSLVLVIVFSFTFYSYHFASQTVSTSNTEENNEATKKKKYIKWFEFNVTYDVLDKTSKLDITSHQKNEAVKYNWVELIAYLACKCGNNFKNFKQKDLDSVVSQLKSGKTMDEITKNMKNYAFYFEAYNAVLNQFIGEYEIEKTNSNNANSVGEATTSTTTVYGLKAFHPIAKNYGYNHYDDFGNSRSYGYQRLHFGNDLMGSVGTPIIATESGVVEALGWNQYGGWRIGIRSFDKKRYYYYAHLRKDHPYAENLKEGQIVQAGDVIGYLGMTGYSTKENINNINVPHLHFGIQLIFDEVQKEGPNQIWVDLYNLVDFLKKNRCEVYKSNSKTKDYQRKYQINDPIIPD